MGIFLADYYQSMNFEITLGTKIQTIIQENGKK